MAEIRILNKTNGETWTLPEHIVRRSRVWLRKLDEGYTCVEVHMSPEMFSSLINVIWYRQTTYGLDPCNELKALDMLPNSYGTSSYCPHLDNVDCLGYKAVKITSVPLQYEVVKKTETSYVYTYDKWTRAVEMQPIQEIETRTFQGPREYEYQSPVWQ